MRPAPACARGGQLGCGLRARDRYQPVGRPWHTGRRQTTACSSPALAAAGNNGGHGKYTDELHRCWNDDSEVCGHLGDSGDHMPRDGPSTADVVLRRSSPASMFLMAAANCDGHSKSMERVELEEPHGVMLPLSAAEGGERAVHLEGDTEELVRHGGRPTQAHDDVEAHLLLR